MLSYRMLEIEEKLQEEVEEVRLETDIFES